MTRTAAYIAGPFSDPSPTIRRWHTARAALLCRLATLLGFAAVCVHPTIAAGGYGDDSDPAQRAAGMEATRAVATLVLSGGGRLWALLHDDGTKSSGTRDEVEIARLWSSGDARWDESTWAEWRTVACTFPTLLPEWDALATRPDAVGEWAIDEPVASRWYGVDNDGNECAALVLIDGWTAYTVDGEMLAEGPETGEAGRDAADAALRAAGVLP